MTRDSTVEPAARPPKGRTVKTNDPAVDYLALSVTRHLSGTISVRLIRLDYVTKRVQPVLLVEGNERRTSQQAMADWLAAGLQQLVLDMSEQGSLF